ncbi:MAG: insulinase family protein, partial [Phycisphaeraceae bacterium]
MPLPTEKGRSMPAHARLATFAAIALLAAAPAASQAEPANTEPTTLQDRDDRLIVQLPNGLIAIAQEVPTAPVVSAQVWVKTGSIYEQEFVGGGISHYLEHLLSGGTTDTRS